MSDILMGESSTSDFDDDGAFEAFEDVFDGEPEEEWDSDRGPALYDGDVGELAKDVRSSLVNVLKHRFLSEQHHRKQWNAMLKHRSVIESRLADLFLELVVDTGVGVAYKRPLASETIASAPRLLGNRNSQYGAQDVLLLSKLREIYVGERVHDDEGRVWRDKDDLVAELVQSNINGTNDEKRRVDQAVSSVGRLIEQGVLIPSEKEGRRLEISPVIQVIVSQEKLDELNEYLSERLSRMDGENPTDDPDADGSGPETMSEGMSE